VQGGTRTTRRQFGLGAAGLASVLLGGCLNRGTDNHGHEHDDPPWEWGGVYELDPGTHSYTYHEGPDPDMRLAFVPAEGGSDHDLFHAGETATELFETEQADTVVTDGNRIQPSSETLYRVDFEPAGETTFDLRVESSGHYSLFTAHVPSEFEAELLSDTGEELAPAVTERHSDHDHEDDEHEDGENPRADRKR
jgi:zinc transport system substrate-binding protein